MGQKSFILVAIVLLAMVGAAGSLYAYDTSNENRIAEGVTVAGVAVGGLDAAQAREKVAHELADRLDEPLVVRHGRQRFTLSAEDAQVRADVGGMVADALNESREGNIFSRVLRDATGGEEDASVPARVSYSKSATGALVERVVSKVNRPARDATLDFPSLERVAEQDGVQVRTGRLTARVDAAMTRATDRRVRVPTKVTKPEVTRAELAEKYPVLLVADRSTFKLRLYRNLELAKEYTVAFGAVGFDTPAGLYHIQNKAVDPAWSVPDSDWAGSLAGTVVPGGVPENPLKERWMGIYDGAGIHGTDDTASLGTAASHGCIRMSIPDVIELYDQVEVQTPIYIA